MPNSVASLRETNTPSRGAPAWGANDYFSIHLRDAVPLDRTTERELTGRIEQLVRERAVTILGFPTVTEHIVARIRHHEESSTQSGARFRAEGTMTRVIAADERINRIQSGAASGSFSTAEALQHLDRIGAALLSDRSLVDTRVIGFSALERYRRLLNVLPSQQTDRSPAPPLFEERYNRLQAIEASLDPLVDTLVRSNLRLVRSIASKIDRFGDLREELIAAGHLTLVRCARDFKTSYEVRFATYAYKSIEHSMRSVLQEQRAAARTMSLHHTMTHRDDAAELIDFIPDSSASDPQDAVAARDAAAKAHGVVQTALADLPAEERTIVERFFGLHGHEPQPLGVIAAELGLSRERVRHRLDRGKMRLRRSLAEENHEFVGIEPPLGDRTEIDLPREPDVRTLPSSTHGERARDQTATVARSSSPLRALPASPQLFEIGSTYAQELARIRRLPLDAAPASPTRVTASLNQMKELHEATAQRWPTGASEHRYGFQLEGEMLALKRELSTTQVRALEQALEAFAARLHNYRLSVAEG